MLRQWDNQVVACRSPVPGVSLPKYWKLVSSLWVDYKMWVMPANWRRGSPPPQLPHLLTPKWFLEERFQDPCINNKSLSGQGRVATCLDEAHEFQFSQKILILQSVENLNLAWVYLVSFDWRLSMNGTPWSSISMMGSQFKIWDEKIKSLCVSAPPPLSSSWCFVLIQTSWRQDSRDRTGRVNTFILLNILRTSVSLFTPILCLSSLSYLLLLTANSASYCRLLSHSLHGNHGSLPARHLHWCLNVSTCGD